MCMYVFVGFPPKPKPPGPTGQGTCKAGCKIWFDGCNQCACVNGKIRTCTRKHCTKKGKPFCKDPKPGPPPAPPRPPPKPPVVPPPVVPPPKSKPPPCFLGPNCKPKRKFV